MDKELKLKIHQDEVQKLLLEHQPMDVEGEGGTGGIY